MKYYTNRGIGNRYLFRTTGDCRIGTEVYNFHLCVWIPYSIYNIGDSLVYKEISEGDVMLEIL